MTVCEAAQKKEAEEVGRKERETIYRVLDSSASAPPAKFLDPTEWWDENSNRFINKDDWWDMPVVLAAYAAELERLRASGAPASAPPASNQKRLSAACEKAAQQIIADSEIRTVDGVADTIYREMRELLQPEALATQSAEQWLARNYPNLQAYVRNVGGKGTIYFEVSKLCEAYAASQVSAATKDLREELELVLNDWNALVAVAGSRTHGGAVQYVAKMRAELERLRAVRLDVDAILRVARGELDRGTCAERLEYIAETARIIMGIFARDKTWPVPGEAKGEQGS